MNSVIVFEMLDRTAASPARYIQFFAAKRASADTDELVLWSDAESRWNPVKFVDLAPGCWYGGKKFRPLRRNEFWSFYVPNHPACESFDVKEPVLLMCGSKGKHGFVANLESFHTRPVDEWLGLHGRFGT